MNVIDIILLVVFLLTVWGGVARGFFAGTAGMISWIGSLLITFALHGYVTNFFETYIIVGIWAMPVAFVLTLLVTSILFSLLMGRVLSTIPQKTQEHRLNAIFGIVPGIIMGILYATILATLLLLLPLSDSLTGQTRESKIAERLTNGLGWIERPFSSGLDAVNRSINRMTINPESSESISLPFLVENAKPRPDLESQMLDLINEERAEKNLPALTLDEKLTPVARQHSEDMFARGYFSHISPEGATPFDRIRAANIRFLAAGENLAIAQTLSLAHTGLMDSPGHRANILRSTYGRVGIGILDGGIHGLMVTQVFRN